MVCKCVFNFFKIKQNCFVKVNQAKTIGKLFKLSKGNGITFCSPVISDICCGKCWHEVIFEGLKEIVVKFSYSSTKSFWKTLMSNELIYDVIMMVLKRVKIISISVLIASTFLQKVFINQSSSIKTACWFSFFRELLVKFWLIPAAKCRLYHDAWNLELWRTRREGRLYVQLTKMLGPKKYTEEKYQICTNIQKYIFFKKFIEYPIFCRNLSKNSSIFEKLWI